MAYSMVLGYGLKNTGKTSATFVGLGNDSVVVSGTGFTYDAAGFLKGGTITRMTFMSLGLSGQEKEQVVTLKASAADLYHDLLSPALSLIKQVDDWSTTDSVTSASSKKIVLEMNDFSQVVITGTGLSEDPATGQVSALQHLDVNGHNLEKITGLHVSLSVAMTALGQSYDIYDYLVQGANTITTLVPFGPRLEGGLGNDTLKAGNAAFATAEYIHTAVAGIHADLGTGKVTGGAGTDRLIGIQALSGSNFNDVLIGKDGKDGTFGDSLHGNGGNDTIDGLGSNDYLYGETGNDRVNGGKGDDRIDGGAGNDKIDGGAGANDVIVFGSEIIDLKGVTISLSKTGIQNFGGWGKDTLVGIEGAYGSNFGDHITGSKGANVLSGGGGSDLVLGMGGNDTLYGQAGPGGYYTEFVGNDTLNGGAGNDTIHASLGADILIGGAGKDTFSFDFLPSTFGGPDVDTIKDFSSRDDTIKLMSLYFDGIDTGKLDKAEFVLGTEAKDAGDRIIYDKSTGHLFYDEDGTGGASQVLLATLTNKAALSFTDFVGF